MIKSSDAIDYDEGLDIYDPVDDKCYSHDEACSLPDDVRARLQLKPRKMGTMVYTVEEIRKMPVDK